MPHFKYKICTEDGNIIKKQVEAENAQAVMAQLLMDDVLIIYVRKINVLSQAFRFCRDNAYKVLPFRKKYLRAFNFQMASLLKAGVSIKDAISHLATTTYSRHLAKALTNVEQRLEGGETLAYAFSGNSRVFGKSYANYLAQAQKIGKIEWAFDHIQALLDKQSGWFKKIVLPLLPYITLLIIAIISLFILGKFVIPPYMAQFPMMNMRAPEVGIKLMSMVKFITHIYPILATLVVIIAAFIVAKYYLRKINNIAYFWDGFLCYIPYVGRYIKLTNKLIFYKIIQVAANQSFPLQKIFTLGMGAISNKFLQGKLERICKRIATGENFLETLNSEKFFDNLEARLLDTGSSTDSFAKSIGILADINSDKLNFAMVMLRECLKILVFLALIFAVYFLVQVLVDVVVEYHVVTISMG